MRFKELTESKHNFNTAYHITTVENSADILYGGLDPREGKIYLVVDTGDQKKLKNELSTVAGWMLAKTEKTEDPLTLLKIDIKGISLDKDSGWYISKLPISYDRITDLGEDAFNRIA